MGNGRIKNVIVNIPDESFLGTLMAEAASSIIANRIAEYPIKDQLLIYEELFNVVQDEGKRKEVEPVK